MHRQTVMLAESISSKTDVYLKHISQHLFVLEQNRDYDMKIFLLFYAFVARFKVTLGQDDDGTDGKDDSPTKIGVGGGSSAAPFAECFKTRCDANSFEMIIEVVKSCPQFESYIGGV